MPAAPTVLTPVRRSLECRFYYNLSYPEINWLSSEHWAVLNWVFMQWIDITDGERCCCSLESLHHQGCEACYIFPSIIFVICPRAHFQSTQGRPMYWHTPHLLYPPSHLPQYVFSGKKCFLNVSDLTYLVQIWMSSAQQFFTINLSAWGEWWICYKHMVSSVNDFNLT